MESVESAKTMSAFQACGYIIKENRTYDQVLGDLKQGDAAEYVVSQKRFSQMLSERAGIKTDRVRTGSSFVGLALKHAI